MLAMERLPLSQPFSNALTLNSPPLESPRAGLPASMGLPSPTMRSHNPHIPPPLTPVKFANMVRPGSSSSLPSAHTPPPYDSRMMHALYSPHGLAPASFSPSSPVTSPVRVKQEPRRNSCSEVMSPNVSAATSSISKGYTSPKATSPGEYVLYDKV